MNRFVVLISFCADFSANSGYNHHNSPHHHHHHHPHHNHHHHQHASSHHEHSQQPRARYYEGSPHIIASPKPKTLNPYAQQAHYGNHVSPVQFVARQSRQETAQLVASASNTPVLVLKKDHSRLVLSSAVAAATKQEKEVQKESAQEPVPTIVMRNPSEQKQQAPPPQKQQQQQQQQAPKQEPKPISVEEDVISEEEQDPNVGNASAERRMFFQNVAANSAPTPQVRPPSPPASPPAPHHDEVEEEERAERIVRSNSNNPYGGGGQFEYPPQSNYISQGPTRVPVKYQQGVIGQKEQRQRPQQQQQQRPYKQRIQQAQREGQQGPGGFSEERELTSEELEEQEAEDAKPDRLQELLVTSKFECGGKKDGYYADDTLNCEVFHYCQDGGKHSWLCPNGFAFHQIHLICVPPSSDNTCKQSSNYHFVNDYLYKAVNEKEASMTNESLKYADRYFPDGYNHGAGDVILPYDEEEEDQPRGHHNQQQQHQQQHHLRPQQQSPHAAFIQAQQQAHQQQQRPRVAVHPSAYNSNPYNQQPSPRPSPLQHGGFIPSPTPSSAHRASHHSPQSHPRVVPQSLGHYAQQRAGSSISPTIIPQQPVSKSSPQGPSHKPQSHSQSSSASQQNPGAVFFSPESINIPLNQRRPIPNPHPSHHPQIFRPSPQVHRSSQSQQPQSNSNRKPQFDEDEEY